MLRPIVNSGAAALFALATLAIVALSVPAPARPRAGPGNQERGGLEVQRGRDERIGARGAKTYYTKRWDLIDLPPYQPRQKVSGTIRVWGSGYFAQGSLGKYWEEGFRQQQPDVKFDYHFQAPALAIPALCVGISDLAPSRHITFDETLMFQRVFSRDPVEISMVTGSLNVPGWNYALGIFVHKDNPISKLTIKQLDGIFGTARDGGYDGTTWRTDIARAADDNIRTWGQLGSTGAWADKRIHVYGYNLRYHIPRTFERLVFQGADKWNEDLHEYANYKSPDGTNMLEAQQVIDAIGKDRYGIGYSSVAYLTPQTKALAVAPRAGGEYVELNLETLRNRTYPLFDEVYFYVNRVPGKPVDPKVKEFLSYVLSREGQDAVQRDAKYLPLTSDVVRQQLKKLE
jgi:phosphate transport system substrate-binding protein